jgi:hypothetical protein
VPARLRRGAEAAHGAGLSGRTGARAQECPDYFFMDYGVSVLKWSDQARRPRAPRRPAPRCDTPAWRPPRGAPCLCARDAAARAAQVRGRTPFAADWYMLSSADARANSSNVAAGGAIGAFNASSSYYGLALTPQCAPARRMRREARAGAARAARAALAPAQGAERAGPRGLTRRAPRRAG